MINFPGMKCDICIFTGRNERGKKMKGKFGLIPKEVHCSERYDVVIERQSFLPLAEMVCWVIYIGSSGT